VSDRVNFLLKYDDVNGEEITKLFDATVEVRLPFQAFSVIPNFSVLQALELQLGAYDTLTVNLATRVTTCANKQGYPKFTHILPTSPRVSYYKSPQQQATFFPIFRQALVGVGEGNIHLTQALDLCAKVPNPLTEVGQVLSDLIQIIAFMGENSRVPIPDVIKRYKTAVRTLKCLVLPILLLTFSSFASQFARASRNLSTQLLATQHQSFAKLRTGIEALHDIPPISGSAVLRRLLTPGASDKAAGLISESQLAPLVDQLQVKYMPVYFFAVEPGNLDSCCETFSALRARGSLIFVVLTFSGSIQPVDFARYATISYL